MEIILNEKNNKVEIGDIIEQDGELFLVTFNKQADYPYILVNLNTCDQCTGYKTLKALEHECDLVCKNKNIALNLNQ